ncbi:MAG: hypothetical protein Q9219_000007 [cf. Caloplaca sp. 3 TL-2023]
MDLLKADGPGASIQDQAPERGPVFKKGSSSPVAPPFMTSAPGKVIVYGEHAVVHGKAAMAAVISLRSYLLVTSLAGPDRTITLRFPDIEFEHSWKIDDLPWTIFSHPSKRKHYSDLVDKLDPELVEAMQSHLSSISPEAPPEKRRTHHSAASAFLYLFLSLGSRDFHGCIYTLRSTIPIGAGLGSSASICVCLSSAILLQLRALCPPYPDQPRVEAELQIERINQWAFVGEMCIHGNPSGVDNTVVTGGKAVVFKRGHSGQPPTVIPLRKFPELPLLLVNTRQSRSTSAEVAKVAALNKAFPAVVEPILESISKITDTAYELISSIGFDAKDSGSVQTLGHLMKINHALLTALGVSHPKLERIRDMVDSIGVGWTKLTGAGGGGSAITLLNEKASPITLKNLEEQLTNEGFEKYETTLGGDGVGVLWPAVLHKTSEDEGGREIHQEELLTAVGREGVERLLGVGTYEIKGEWNFWSNIGAAYVNGDGK